MSTGQYSCQCNTCEDSVFIQIRSLSQNLDVAHLEPARGGPRVLYVPDQHGEDDATGRMHKNPRYGAHVQDASPQSDMLNRLRRQIVRGFCVFSESFFRMTIQY